MRVLLFVLLFACFTGQNVFGEDVLFSAQPYNIQLCFVSDAPLTDSEQHSICETLQQRSKNYAGQRWNLTVQFADTNAAAAFAQYAAQPPDKFNKVFLAVLHQTELQLQEFDVPTRWTGRKQTYCIERPEKLADVLWQGLTETFSPVARLEKASPSAATLRIQSSDLFTPQNENFLTQKVLQRKVLLPFLRFKDPDGKTAAVSPIPYTVLLAEQLEEPANLLQCKVNSSLPGALTARRRGQTDVLALAVETPMKPTLLQVLPRLQENTEQTLQTQSVYDVLEFIPGEPALKPLGQTQTDGSFLLEPLAEQWVRTIFFRSGRSVIAKLPVVRGLGEKVEIPVPDDAVRLAAEAVLVGIQEDLIDTAARRQLLEQQLKTLTGSGITGSGTEKQIREVRSELAKLKDANRFMIELEQFKLHFRSDDPLVQKRINRLLNETRKAVASSALR